MRHPFSLPRQADAWLRAMWLELLLALAVVALVFQLFPGLYHYLLSWVDVRQWSRSNWLVMNVLIVLALVGIRYGPELMDSWRERQARRAKERENQTKQLELKQRREAIERVKAARNRRVW